MEIDQAGSRTVLTAVLLTLTGGYLDAYTYFVRDGFLRMRRQEM